MCLKKFEFTQRIMNLVHKGMQDLDKRKTFNKDLSSGAQEHLDLFQVILEIMLIY